jgi:hemolysin-activating ACP:hemolysin acyltransferase
MFWKKSKPEPAGTIDPLPPVNAPIAAAPAVQGPAEQSASTDRQVGANSGPSVLLSDPSLAALFSSLSASTDGAAPQNGAGLRSTATENRTPRTITPSNARPWCDAALGLGEVMSVLQRSARHRRATLGDLDWMILPALRYGQYRIAKDAKRGGTTPPEAVIAWAKVSPAVDARIMANPHQAIHLAPGEWQSGDIVWIVDAAGSSRVIAQMMQQLARDILQVPVKFRAAGPQGVLQVRVLNPEKVHKFS